MDKKLRYIYRITNLINGKTYIGQRTSTCGKVEDDIYFGSGKLIKLAEQKYGIDKFKKEILISGLFTKEELDKLEIEYILGEKQLGHGEYNISTGGQQGGNMGDVWLERVRAANQTDTHRDNLRKSLIEASARMSDTVKKERSKKGEETRKKRGISHNTFGGRHHTEETKQKISKANSEIFQGKNNPSYGKHWFTDGNTNVLCKECPTGFLPGKDGSAQKRLEHENIKNEKQLEKEELINKILNCDVDLQAYNVYSLLAQKLGLERTFIKRFVKRNMKEHKELFYNRKEHMSR